MPQVLFSQHLTALCEERSHAFKVTDFLCHFLLFGPASLSLQKWLRYLLFVLGRGHVWEVELVEGNWLDFAEMVHLVLWERIKTSEI